MLDLSLFRSLPHFLKQQIFNDGSWFLTGVVASLTPEKWKKTVSNDYPFETATLVNNAVLKIDVGLKRKSFKYYHTKGAHEPFSYNKNYKLTKEFIEPNKDNYKNEIIANLNAVCIYLDLLRSKGIYDNSLIFITGDHGYGLPEGMYVNPESKLPKFIDNFEPSSFKRNFQTDKGRGIPLILVKRFKAKGKLTISDSPVSTLDIKSTIFSELNIKAKDMGKSMFDIKQSEQRIRNYHAFSFAPEKKEFFPAIMKYQINGHSWSDESWFVSNILLPPID